MGTLNSQDGCGMFKTPRLCNIARTAPDMHKAVFSTLEEMVDFYTAGGGDGLKVYNQDSQVAQPDLYEYWKKDLVSFLQALGDLAGGQCAERLARGWQIMD